MQDSAGTEHWLRHEDPRVAQLNAWITQAGASDQPLMEMLESYCKQLTALGLPLMRLHVTVNALHPVYGGLGFEWTCGEDAKNHRYARTDGPADSFLKSPFYYMLTQGQTEYRERLAENSTPSRFALLNDMRTRGATDYLAAGMLFGARAGQRPTGLEERMEGVLISWTTHARCGFSDRDITLIRTTLPVLCLALRAGSNRRTAEDLLGIYLGRDAGRRVLSGEIQRGSTQWIDAVICYFDLEGFTGLSQRIAGEDLIALLNTYFGLVVGQIEAQGGNVLKFMGDGLLAIFDRDEFPDAPDRALAAVRALRPDIDALNASHRAAEVSTLDYTVALHAGPVLYGNIGGDERLDFTVIGPEVNLAARIGGMHKSLGQKIVVSQALAWLATPTDFELISLGRYMLRGVDHPQELFTIYTNTG